jgi:hypothetical protein
VGGRLRIHGQVDQPAGNGPLAPRPAPVATDQETPVRRIEAVNPAWARAKDVEVSLTEERDRLPGPSSIGGLDQSEVRRQVLLPHRLRVGVARAKKPIGADDGEAHGVLEAVPSSDRLLGARRNAVRPGVGGDEQRLIRRVDPQAVNVDRAWIAGREQIADGAPASFLATAHESQHREQNHGSAQRKEGDQEPGALRCSRGPGLNCSGRGSLSLSPLCHAPPYGASGRGKRARPRVPCRARSASG